MVTATMSQKKMEDKVDIKPVKKLIWLAVMWGIILSTAIFLIINLFKDQWTNIKENVVMLINGEEKSAMAVEEKEASESAETKENANKENKNETTIDVKFIEGLVEAILTASESAQVATEAASVEEITMANKNSNI